MGKIKMIRKSLANITALHLITLVLLGTKFICLINLINIFKTIKFAKYLEKNLP
jgi:L-lactate permease